MITKLKGYRADAEILGEIREIEFEGGRLTIDDVTLSDVGQILNRLCDKAVVAIQLPDEAPAKDVPAARPMAALEAVGEGKQLAAPQGEPPARAEPPPPPPAEARPRAAQPAPGGGSVPPEISGAAKFAQVIDYLTNVAGLKTADDVIAACERYREHSPLLQRVRDLSDRVHAHLG